MEPIVYSVAFVAIDSANPEAQPLTEAHWELSQTEYEAALVAFTAKAYSTTGTGTTRIHVTPINT